MRRRGRIGVGLVALLVLAGALVTAGVVVDGEPSESQADREMLQFLMSFVEHERGLRFLRPVPVHVLEDDDFADAFVHDALHDPNLVQQIEIQQASVEAFGFEDFDDEEFGIEEMLEQTASAALGFFSPTTGAVFVRGKDMTPLVSVVLAHELTHALDFQWFQPLEDEVVLDDASLAQHALIEGNATRVERALAARMTEEGFDELDEELDESFEGLTVVDLFDREADFLYGNGAEFVHALVEEGGNDAVNAAFRHPPGGSAHILEPDDYLDGVAIRHLPPVRADGEILARGALGPAAFGVLPADGVEVEAGQWVLYRGDDGHCMAIAVSGDEIPEDDLGDLEEFAPNVETQNVGDISLLRTCSE